MRGKGLEWQVVGYARVSNAGKYQQRFSHIALTARIRQGESEMERRRERYRDIGDETIGRDNIKDI